VILAAESDGVLRPIKEERRSLLRSEDLVPLPLALAVGHVHGWSPEDAEDVLHCWKATDTPISTILLSLVLLRGDATVLLLEHAALLEGVVDWGLVARA
jgi:hypothetical protein